MRQIISIDENSRIIIEPENYILQYRRKSKKCLAYRTDGYFPDLVSLANEYLNTSPQHADNAIKSIDEMVAIIKEAETRICEKWLLRK